MIIRKVVTLEVTGCQECPHMRESSLGFKKYHCGHLSNPAQGEFMTIETPLNAIPKWCPLEDVESPDSEG